MSKRPAEDTPGAAVSSGGISSAKKVCDLIYEKKINACKFKL